MKSFAAVLLTLAIVAATGCSPAAETPAPTGLPAAPPGPAPANEAPGAAPANSGNNAAGPAITSKVAAKTVSTFHCLSLYWSPEQGGAGKNVQVKFRRAGETGWHEGLPMRYNPVKTPECKADYRGSIVNLQPGSEYEIALTLEGGAIRTVLKASTWSETFPVAETVKVSSGAQTLHIDKSGSETGYILYDGTGCVLDGANKIDHGILVDGAYVILRGFTIKNVKLHGIRINTHHVVIEDCDFSKWGSEEERGFGFDSQAGVWSNKKDLHAVVVQRCKFHNPSWDSNSWAEDHFKGKHSPHPDGPQTIVFWEAEGNNVIRYNECWSDPDHYYNDVMGGGQNGSYRGWPGADSDIYCNYIANCWDDGIEVEGGGQNVRIWNNYIENTMMTIADAANSIGPLYIWRNVGGRSYSPPGSEWNLTHGYFMKMGYADSENWMTGHMYVFNNTVFQPKDEGAEGLGGSGKLIKHCVTRNNILQSRSNDSHSIATDKGSIDNDFDYDLCSGRFPSGAEQHGVQGKPEYPADAGFDFEKKIGNFQQAAGSPGIDKGVVIPNFCDVYSGAAPDLGAQEAGAPAFLYGVKAQFVPPGTPAPAGAGSGGSGATAVAFTPPPVVEDSPERKAAIAKIRDRAKGLIVKLLPASQGVQLTLALKDEVKQVALAKADAEAGITVKAFGAAQTLAWNDLTLTNLAGILETITPEDGDDTAAGYGAIGLLYAADRKPVPAAGAIDKAVLRDPDLKDDLQSTMAALR